MPTHVASSFTGAIAAPHATATEAGRQAYRDGGNAIDAAIAAAAVLTVVYPHNVALGGDLLALVRTPEGVVTCVNSSGWAGMNADVAAMRARYGVRLPVRGADTVTVPGGVRGWEALRCFGSRLSWDRTLQPAQEAAGSGVPIPASLAAHVADPKNADLIGTGDFDRMFRPNGEDLRRGEALRQPALESTFRTLRQQGPDVFYEGALAERTVNFLRLRGSSLVADDFVDFHPEIVEPIHTLFRGLTVLTSPPNTHGFILLRALAALDALEVTDPLGDDLGTLMRIFHHGNHLRSTALADPRHATVDVGALVNGDIRDLPVFGDDQGGAPGVPRGDTVGVAAADSDGFAVSLIQSVYFSFGSGLIDPETGILFHNRGTGFSLDPHSPNVIAPRKRPAHTLMPVMTTRRGELRHVLATMGGQGQPQIIAQLLLQALGGAGAEAAAAAPRAIVGMQAAGSFADSVSVEADLPAAALNSAIRSGLPVMTVPPHSERHGHSNVVFVGEDGSMTAASDPRSDGGAVVAQFTRTARLGLGG